MAEAANDFNRDIVAKYRENGGDVGPPFGDKLLLLTTTGAKSGKKTVSPIMYTDDGDRLLVYASKAGAPTNPAWYLNLLANPRVSVEVGTDSFEAEATPIEGPERDRLYAEQVERVPGFGEYQEKTDRVIPVVALTRVG